MSTNHLDVGVGTGYFLNKCLKENTKRVCLFDLNENSLNQAKNSIKRFNVKTYKVNVLEEINVKCEKFDSISINYLLHCLPGSLSQKTICFSYLDKYLNDNAIIFGSTILAKNTKKNYFAKKLMAIYNKKGIFSNSEDSVEDLESSLHKYFTNVKIEIKGTVAIFSAKKK
ncbi:MAG: class I SAM-dependent methyltransferase [Campylobacterales bacterium]|nr:class I SAM-dependent methyltransferase [Campylobacterales bacterium]